MKNEITIQQDDKSLLSPSNFEHAFRMANMICKSAMVPKAYANNPQDVLIAMEMGRALNLSPLAAVQNIAVINGKPTLYGDGIMAVCSGHPDFEDMKEEPLHDDKGAVIGYCCTVKRRGRSPVSQSFTVHQANAAGLWGRQGPWKAYPERMLQMRARSFALRDCFADALGGVRVVEEVQDYVEIKNVTPKQKAEEAKADLLGMIQKDSE